MNFDVIENLSIEDIGQLYNDIIEGSESRLVEMGCTILKVTCPNGRITYFDWMRTVGQNTTVGHCFDCSKITCYTIREHNPCDGVYNAGYECVEKFVTGYCTNRVRNG